MLLIGKVISIIFLICQGCSQVPVGKAVVRSSGHEAILPGAWQTTEYLPLLSGKKVGLVVNHTSLIGNTHLVDTLIASGVNVVKLFAPEHGLRGEADAGTHINDSTDAKTGIRILSIYGSKKKPNTADLKGIDILVFDIQDVGVRFYTYISTLHYVMEAAGEHNIPVIVLDRPNPNGHYIDGPVLDTTTYRSFVGMHPIPVVYGMTIGELGQMINGEKWIKSTCQLTVIQCKNYTHTKPYVLPVKPSPNLPNQRAIMLYPGICFFEGTSGSLGRGTKFPFQVAGHPQYPDKSFSFTPHPTSGAMDPPLKGKICYGVDLTNTNVDSLYNNAKLELSVLLDFYKKITGESFFNASWFDKLAGGPHFRLSIMKGWNEEQIRQSWQKDIELFKKKRQQYLIYEDAKSCLPQK